jgi:hypothetical protein
LFETAQDFATELQKLRALIKGRAAQRLEAYQRSQGIAPGIGSTTTTTADGTVIIKSRSCTVGDDDDDDDSNEQQHLMITGSSEINLLIEIVSATDLPIADLHKTDPYVVVYMGKHRIHKTQYISSK